MSGGEWRRRGGRRWGGGGGWGGVRWVLGALGRGDGRGEGGGGDGDANTMKSWVRLPATERSLAIGAVSPLKVLAIPDAVSPLAL